MEMFPEWRSTWPKLVWLLAGALLTMGVINSFDWRSSVEVSPAGRSVYVRVGLRSWDTSLDGVILIVTFRASTNPALVNWIWDGKSKITEAINIKKSLEVCGDELQRDQDKILQITGDLCPPVKHNEWVLVLADKLPTEEVISCRTSLAIVKIS